jgi:hypothetical protein
MKKLEELRIENMRLRQELMILKRRMQGVNVFPSPLRRFSDAEVAKEVICEFFGINIDTKTRKSDYVRARYMYFYWVRNNTHMSLAEIGKSLTLMQDHSTIVNALRKHNDDYDTNKVYRDQYDKLVNIIEEHIIEQQKQHGMPIMESSVLQQELAV